jgi:hypothetical protein
MLMDLLHRPDALGDPALWWLMVISSFREEAPWLFELGMEVHKALKAGEPRRISAALQHFDDSLRMLRHTEIGHYLIDSSEMDMVMHELPHLLHTYVLGEPPPPKVAGKAKTKEAQN